MAELGVIRSHKRQRRGAKGMGETKAPKLNARQNKGMLNRKEYVKRTFAAKESNIALAKEARAKLGPALAKYLRRNDEKSLIPLAADPSNVTDKEAMLFQRAQVVNKFLELLIKSNNEKRLVNQRACAIGRVDVFGRVLDPPVFAVGTPPASRDPGRTGAGSGCVACGGQRRGKRRGRWR